MSLVFRSRRRGAKKNGTRGSSLHLWTLVPLGGYRANCFGDVGSPERDAVFVRNVRWRFGDAKEFGDVTIRRFELEPALHLELARETERGEMRFARAADLFKAGDAKVDVVVTTGRVGKILQAGQLPELAALRIRTARIRRGSPLL